MKSKLGAHIDGGKLTRETYEAGPTFLLVSCFPVNSQLTNMHNDSSEKSAGILYVTQLNGVVIVLFLSWYAAPGQFGPDGNHPRAWGCPAGKESPESPMATDDTERSNNRATDHVTFPHIITAHCSSRPSADLQPPSQQQLMDLSPIYGSMRSKVRFSQLCFLLIIWSVCTSDWSIVIIYAMFKVFIHL